MPFVSGSEMIESFTKLLDEADEYDTIHDIVLQVCTMVLQYTSNPLLILSQQVTTFVVFSSLLLGSL